MTPLVSVLTPSFNQASWLADNLRSVQNQTYEHIEHLVMDGGSTDGSIDILKSSGRKVHWRSEPDRGQSHALNKAFEVSKGEIIGWLNSDDAYVHKCAVEAAVDVFDRHPEVGVVYGHGLLVNQSNCVLQYLWAPKFSRAAMTRGTFFVQPSVFIRRSVVTGPLVNEDLQFIMDRDLWWRLLDQTKFQRLDMVIGLDRHQPQRKTLQIGYPKEIESYERNRGIPPRSACARGSAKLQKILFRLWGVIGSIRLEHVIDPAIHLRYGSLQKRVRLQLLTPRRNMPLE